MILTASSLPYGLFFFFRSFPFLANSRMINAKYFLHVTYVLKIASFLLILVVFLILNCKLLL